MLDEFSESKQSKKPESAITDTTHAAEAQSKALVPEELLGEDDFASQLQAGMADLLGELQSSVGYMTTNLMMY
jgi:hypothetical protein